MCLQRKNIAIVAVMICLTGCAAATTKTASFYPVLEVPPGISTTPLQQRELRRFCDALAEGMYRAGITTLKEGSPDSVRQWYYRLMEQARPSFMPPQFVKGVVDADLDAYLARDQYELAQGVAAGADQFRDRAAYACNHTFVGMWREAALRHKADIVR